MKITRSNYESWFLDFLEGNLESSIMDEFQEFLKMNPDLAAELDMAEQVTLEANKSIRFETKDELKKPDIDHEIEFQERAIAYYEGDLTLEERLKFEASLSENSIHSSDAEQFGKLKLVADKTIVYDHKEQLKKKVTILPLWIKVASAAAILLFAYLLFQPGVGVRPELRQLADDLKNKEPKNVTVPAKKVKVEEKSAEKVTPEVTTKPIPATAPVKKKQNPTEQKSDKKVTPAPHLRAPEPEPSLLKSRSIYFGHTEDVELAVMTIRDTTEASQEYQLSELLKVQLAAIRKSDDREFLSTENLGLSGLHLIAKISGKRLTARKADDGTVRSVSFNSRLLAFSIPVNR